MRISPGILSPGGRSSSRFCPIFDRPHLTINTQSRLSLSIPPTPLLSSRDDSLVSPPLEARAQTGALSCTMVLELCLFKQFGPGRETGRHPEKEIYTSGIPHLHTALTDLLVILNHSSLRRLRLGSSGLFHPRRMMIPVPLQALNHSSLTLAQCAHSAVPPVAAPLQAIAALEKTVLMVTNS